MTVDTQKEEILETVAGFIREVIGEEWVLEKPITMETAFGSDLELESIEIVALSEKLQERYGEQLDLAGWLSAMKFDEIIGLDGRQARRPHRLVPVAGACPGTLRAPVAAANGRWLRPQSRQYDLNIGAPCVLASAPFSRAPASRGLPDRPLEVNGLRVHAVELGAGPPVVLVHGIALSNLSLWYFGAAPALARRRRVVLYDLRGHGLSESAENGYSSEVLAGDLEGVLDRLCPALQPVDLVGFSFGGVVALRFCLEHPERVRRLALVEMPLPPIDPSWLESLLDPEAAERAQLVPASLQQALARGGRQAVRHAERLRAISEETTLMRDVESERPFTQAELGELDLPVLLCYGTETACPAAADWLREVLPAAEVRVVEGGHYLPLDAPEALGDAISDFLDA